MIVRRLTEAEIVDMQNNTLAYGTKLQAKTTSKPVNLRQAMQELATGNIDPFLNALGKAGHSKAVNIIALLKPATIKDFAISVGLNDLSSWTMPFLKLLDKTDMKNVLVTDGIFTKAYNLLYRMRPVGWFDSYINNKNAIVFTRDFFNYIKDPEDAMKLMKYDSTIVSDAGQSRQLKNAIKNGDYGKFISDVDGEEVLNADDEKFLKNFEKYIKNAPESAKSKLIDTIEKSKK